MRFLADDNFDNPILKRLRDDGHEILEVPEKGIGLKDEAVIQYAQLTKATLLTGDKDFGELVFRQNLVTHGVILIRLGVSPKNSKI